jgi:integrase
MGLRRLMYTLPIPEGARPVTIRARRGHVVKEVAGVRFCERSGKMVNAPLNRSGDRIRLHSKDWYGFHTDRNGVKYKWRLATDRTAAETLFNEFRRAVERGEASLDHPRGGQRKRPLGEHLAEWEESLNAHDRHPKYVALKLARVRAIVDGAGFVFPADLDAVKVERFLARRRNEDDLSVQSSNHYLQAIKQFVKWLVDHHRLDRDPLTPLKAGNVKVDRRHDRRDVSPEECARLLKATRESKVRFMWQDGNDRFHLYLTALGTGLRAQELAALTPESFDLDADPPVVALSASETKNRSGALQPLPPDVVAALRDYLPTIEPSKPVWKGSWWTRASEMLQIDLEKAGIPFQVDGPDGPLFADFHALRHSFISSLERAGLSPKTAQALARHADVRLTLQRYTHKTLHDLGRAVEKLPGLLPVEKVAHASR